MSKPATENQIKISINNKEFEVDAGSMLIEVADQVDIHIPRFCYHKKLSVAANCRMCLVEVENAPKPLPACATPVTDGMKVWTKSKAALAAQKDTMEFLLINHPLDCPICDQGGECELQDLSMAFGGDSSEYHEIKRVVADKDIGELVATEMTRCIQCTRCVRFGEEVSGMREMGATGRGDRMEIGTYVQKSLNSELSGNIIDICPVGALTAKPSRYHSRAWEMMQSDSIASHDSVGSNVRLHTFKNKLVRVVAGENEEINECWISDRDRFSYQGVYSGDRVKTPMIKKNGVWKEVNWQTALEETVSQLRSVDADDIGIFASPRASVEELYLLQKCMRSIGVNNIDHRLRQVDFNDQETMGLFPWLGMSIAEIENQDVLLLVGSNVRRNQPMLNHRIRKASLKGAKVMCINPIDVDFNYPLEVEISSNPREMLETLVAVAKAAKIKAPKGSEDLFKDTKANVDAKAIFKTLKDAKNSAVFLGAINIQHPSYSTIRVLSLLIAEKTGSTFGYLGESANTSGAWLSGFVPHRKEAGEVLKNQGMHTSQMLSNPRKVYVLLDVEPEADMDNPQQARVAMDQADCVIAVTPYANDSLLSTANIILPSSAYSETSGTYVNVEGTWQSFKAAAKSYKDARPAWKIFRVLGNMLDVEGFDYISSSDVKNEIEELCSKAPTVDNTFEITGEYQNMKAASKDKLYRIGMVGEFCNDSLVRRATALQKSNTEQNAVQINAKTAENAGLDSLPDNETSMVNVKQGEVVVTMPLQINEHVPDNCAVLASGTEASRQLGSAFGEIEISV